MLVLDYIGRYIIIMNMLIPITLFLKDPQSEVCAKVRIQINQRITLTRTGFQATLTLQNGETSSLRNLRVIINIYSYDTNEDSMSKFAIGGSHSLISFDFNSNYQSCNQKTTSSE